MFMFMYIYIYMNYFQPDVLQLQQPLLFHGITIALEGEYPPIDLVF